MTIRTTAILLSASVMFGTQAFAAPITFDFTNPNLVGQPGDANRSSLQFRQRGVQLDITAGNFGFAGDLPNGNEADIFDQLPTAGDLNPNSITAVDGFRSSDIDGNIDGIGVEFRTGDRFDANQADALNGNDFLRFSFSSTNGASRNVTLTSVTFGLAGTQVATANDNFDFAIDGVDQDVVGLLGNSLLASFSTGPTEIQASRVVDFTAPGSDPNTPTFLLPPGVTFDFFSDDINDDWVIAGLTVDVQPAVVPVPASALLLLSGLFALGYTGYRRRRAV